MPKKIRDLKYLLRRAGFEIMAGRGKGSHTMWRHVNYRDLIVELSGNDGDDAHRYHEKDVANSIAEALHRDRSK